MAKSVKKPMSSQDKLDWDELYDYVRFQVLKYDNNQSLTRTMVLRLKGLVNNKFIDNNNIPDTANYSYKVILNTFKFCILDIQKGLTSNSFKDENHKFNYIIKIVESKLNDVYIRMKTAEKSKSQTHNIDTTTATSSGAEYQRKTKATSNKKFESLW